MVLHIYVYNLALKLSVFTRKCCYHEVNIIKVLHWMHKQFEHVSVNYTDKGIHVSQSHTLVTKLSTCLVTHILPHLVSILGQVSPPIYLTSPPVISQKGRGLYRQIRLRRRSNRTWVYGLGRQARHRKLGHWILWQVPCLPALQIQNQAPGSITHQKN